MNYFLKKGAVTLAGIFAFVILTIQLVFVPYKNNIVSTVASVPVSAGITVVFGGGMIDKDTMTPMQEDRVKQAVELYKAKKTDRLFLTGDDGGNHYNEVHAMEALAVSLGVPKEKIEIDPHGYRTYESCYRLKHVYNEDTIIAVSQSFHLPRVRYLCERMGVHTVGLAANLRDYGWRGTRAEIRELLANVKAVLQIEVTKPLPRVMAKD